MNRNVNVEIRGLVGFDRLQKERKRKGKKGKRREEGGESKEKPNEQPRNQIHKTCWKMDLEIEKIGMVQNLGKLTKCVKKKEGESFSITLVLGT